MKKLLAVIVAAALVAGLYYLVSSRPSVSRMAPGLLPADVPIFLHLPDAGRTNERWEETALHAIANEPGVNAFLKSLTTDNDAFIAFRERIKTIGDLKPKEVFLAVTSLEESAPGIAAGFQFAGDPAQVEAFIEEGRNALKAAQPSGTFDIAQRGDETIETFTSSQGELAAVFHEDWYLIATGTALLEEMLARFEGASDDETLADDPQFKRSMKELPDAYDAMLYVQPAIFADRVMAIAGIADVSSQQQKQLAQLKQIKALTAATSLDGKSVRDTIFILAPDFPKSEEMERETLRFTSPDTLLYYAAAMSAPREEFQMPEGSLDMLGIAQLLNAFKASLLAHDLEAGDFMKAFGPEIAIALDWAKDGPQPKPIVAVEVRDRELAQRFVTALLDPNLIGAQASLQEIEGVAYHALPQMPWGTPTLAVGEDMLAMGLNFEQLTNAMAGRGETLDTTQGYREVADDLIDPTSAFGFLDAKAAFERIYGLVQPTLVMMAAFSQSPDGPDFSKLPPAAEIARHLGPIAVSQATVKDGVLMESVGPVTFNQVILGAVGTGAWIVAFKRPDEAGAQSTTIPQPQPLQAPTRPVPPPAVSIEAEEMEEEAFPEESEAEGMDGEDPEVEAGEMPVF